MSIDENKIMWLLSTFDDARSSFFNCYYRGDLSSWQPRTEKEKQAFAELTASVNRAALKTWYSRSSSINSAAEAFRQILQRAINEDLPLGTDDNQ
jgi:hypothetical protein